MAKYPIEKYYVGVLHIGSRFDSLLKYGITSEEKERAMELDIGLFNMATFNGAVDIKRAEFEETDASNKICYSSVFTLFYQNGNDTYTCLHNGVRCEPNGFDYCSDLVPLSECLPKIATKEYKELSTFRAKHIFNILYNSKRKSMHNS